jgi:hypothetical protein
VHNKEVSNLTKHADHKAHSSSSNTSCSGRQAHSSSSNTSHSGRRAGTGMQGQAGSWLWSQIYKSVLLPANPKALNLSIQCLASW